jgi:hypothetical protein
MHRFFGRPGAWSPAMEKKRLFGIFGYEVWWTPVPFIWIVAGLVAALLHAVPVGPCPH